MVFGAYTWLDAILVAVGDRVSAKTGLSRDVVFESLAADSDHLAFPPADRFVTIAPTRATMDQRLAAGAGRYTSGFDGTLRVTMFARFANDQELRNAQILRDATRGVLGLWQRVLDGLHMHEPMNAAGECILKEPMRNVGFSVQPARTREGPWCVCLSDWDVKFIATLPSGNS